MFRAQKERIPQIFEKEQLKKDYNKVWANPTLSDKTDSE